jgi:cytochrome c oxidase cbb3-type subunit 3
MFCMGNMMNNILHQGLTALLFVALSSSAAMAERIYEKQDPPRKLTIDQAKDASANYPKYCSLCYGENRGCYKNNHAPSLRSKTLFESGVPHSIFKPISYSRQGNTMAGYFSLPVMRKS